MGAGASAKAQQITDDLPPESKNDLVKIKSLASATFGEEKVTEEMEAKFSEHVAAGGNLVSFMKDQESVEDDEEDEPMMTVEEAMAAGSALGDLFKKKAEVGEVMQEHKALVFDCGTGETKAIFLKYYRVDDGTGNTKPVVEMKELNKAPATLDFLKGMKATDNEDYKTKCKQVETGLTKKGKPAFKSEEDREKARAGLNDGYWFLKAKPEGATDELLPEYFVQFCLETKAKLEAEGNNPGTVMIGCSAWARDAGALQDKADQLVKDLSEAGLLCKKLLQTQEGLFEAAAVGYAYNAMMAGDDGVERLPTGLIGSGGGSVQFMNSMLYPINMDCGNRMCLDAMNDVYDDTSEDAGLASLDACFAKSDSFASKENVTTTTLHGRVYGEIVEERQRTEKQFAGNDVAKAAINSKLRGNVICISACYYGAISIGKANTKDLDMAEYPAKQIIEEMHAKIAQDKEELRAGKHVDVKTRKTMFKEIANLTLQTSLFQELFADDCMLCFKRNWTLNGVPFRTTWTAGWYLNFLFSLNIKPPGSRGILEEYEKTRKAAQALLDQAAGRLGDGASEDVAMVLVDMKTVIKGMRMVALKIANPIDKFLKDIASRFNGDMFGWPKYKIKGNGSLYRKLIGTIFELLKKNEDVPSYTPNIEECVSTIHDCLRYTLTFPPEKYTDAVKQIEKELLQGEGHKGKSIKFKNFWRENDGETTYQGINAQVCLNPVQDLPVEETPIDTTADIDEGEGDVYSIPATTGEVIPNSDNFIFELQLHTPQSYAMKDGPGHLLYEDFRDPAIRKGDVMGKHYDGTADKAVYDAYKMALYQANKKLFMSVDEDGNPLKEGDVVCKGLKKTENHKFTDEDYTYKRFKPTTSIAFYQSGIDGANWVNALQVTKKMERKITGLRKPFGYRIAKTEEEHANYLAEIKEGKHKWVGK